MFKLKLNFKIKKKNKGGEESKETEGLVIIDATPLTLGIELEGGIMAAILPKGSFIPTKKSKVFSTS